MIDITDYETSLAESSLKVRARANEFEVGDLCKFKCNCEAQDCRDLLKNELVCIKILQRGRESRYLFVVVNRR